jgi:hypothetical protein
MIAKYKNIIIILVIIVLGLVAYSFLKPSPTAESLLATTQRQDSAQVLGDEITSAISQINSLKLDRAVLDDPIVKNLIDHSKPILPEPVGRKNPFAPIGKDSASDSATSTASLKISTTTTPAQPAKVNTGTSTTVR